MADSIQYRLGTLLSSTALGVCVLVSLESPVPPELRPLRLWFGGYRGRGAAGILTLDSVIMVGADKRGAGCSTEVFPFVCRFHTCAIVAAATS